jgi:phospholipid/cholesterol/gamma-HCH transport system substrate-binding protein
MSAKANHFKLGLFIIAAVAIGIAAVLVLGAGKLFQKNFTIETYLDQSVQGVDIGSKVKYRGVPIGTIRKIDFTRNRYPQEKTRAPEQSYVLLEIEITSMPFTANSHDTIERALPKEVERGLRTRLTTQGVTGIAYIEVDYLDPAKYPPLPIDWVPENPYIPSAPSVLSRIVSSAEDVFTELEQIDFSKLARGVDRLITSLDAKVAELPLALLSTNTVGLLTEVRDSNRRIQALLGRPEIDTMLNDLFGTATSLRRTAEFPGLTNSIAQLESTLRKVDRLVDGKDYDLGEALNNLRILTENLKELSENAKRFPAQLLFGEPPQPSRNIR